MVRQRASLAPVAAELQMRFPNVLDYQSRALADIVVIFDTPVTLAALPALARLPKLLRIYAGETESSAEASIPQEIAHKLVF